MSKRSMLLWGLALLITLSSAVYQRMTGPTHPARGSVTLGQTTIRFKLPRTHGGETPQVVSLPVGSIAEGETWGATLRWKRYKTQDEWTLVPMTMTGGEFKAELPGQPPAGKLQYVVELRRGDQTARIPEKDDVVIRWKGEVPLVILIPHIIAMFSAMMVAARTALEILAKGPNFRKLAYWSVGLLLFGGMFLGPLVQQYAFGALWTGFPFGTDLTDNKTLIAVIGWLGALAALRFARKPQLYVLGAVIIMFGVYMIPHSMRGSELDYNKIDAEKRAAATSLHPRP